MFQKLYWRMTGMILLAIFLAVLVTGALNFVHVVDLCKEEFISSAKAVQESDLLDVLRDILNSEQEDAVKIPQAEGAISGYAGALGLNENRSYLILSARDGSVILPAALRMGKPETTKNIDAAMRGGKGDEIRTFGDVLDYALFIKNGPVPEDGYIFYLRDNKLGMKKTMKETGFTILWAMLSGMVLAVVVGFLVARAMVRPLRQLQYRAESFAKGDFTPSLEKPPEGELGDLLRSFNRIGSVMNETLNQMNTEKHKVEVILEHMKNGIIAFDTDQKIIHINPEAKRMFAIEQTDGIRFDTFFQKIGENICMAEFMYLDRFKTEERDLEIDKKHIKAYLVPFYMDSARVGGVICVFEDVTEQFNLEAARQKFVAEVSHELKTPLTTIRTYTETLLNGYLDDKKTAVSLLTTVENETDKMNALVQNLLILNRFDMQRVDIQKEFFSLDEMLRRLTDMFAIEAEQKGLSLTYNRTTEMEDIFADEDQIERAVKNIISNSIKYCARGDKIQIFAGNLYNNIYIKVEDSGKGIPKADLEHVFERFYRVDKARSREKGGTGLGLSITKEIIESHGGTITIESEFGRFTRVTINLPLPEKAK